LTAAAIVVCATFGTEVFASQRHATSADIEAQLSRVARATFQATDGVESALKITAVCNLRATWLLDRGRFTFGKLAGA
jgi:hypothetical protein